MAEWKDLRQSLERLDAALSCFPRSADFDLRTITQSQLRQVKTALGSAALRITDLLGVYDPVLDPGRPFDPGSPELFSRVIADELTRQPAHPLSRLRRFYGSGVYALYYSGPHPAYRIIRGTLIPIYVGQAEPESPNAVTPAEQGERLHGRLSEHSNSIALAEAHLSRTLRMKDFSCRYLVLDSAWQDVSETYLIRHFQPVWNKETRVCMGLGKHGDAYTTRDNRRSDWDTLHPGRLWATKAGVKVNKRTRAQIQADILLHCERYIHAGLVS